MDELREKYLQGKLSDDERKEFEAGLSEEERRALAFDLGIKEGIESEIRKELREKVSSFERSAVRKKRSNPVYIGIVASLILAASFALYLTRQEKSLFEDYYQVYPNYELTSLRGEEELTLRESAYQAYDRGDYELASTQFEKLDSVISADFFFKGISHLELNEDMSAILSLQEVIKQGDSTYQSPARWYLALIYLRQDRFEQTIPLLKQLESGNSEYANSSRELLEELSR